MITIKEIFPPVFNEKLNRLALLWTAANGRSGWSIRYSPKTNLISYKYQYGGGWVPYMTLEKALKEFEPYTNRITAVTLPVPYEIVEEK